ncbi:hypothetical protein SLEP1_g57384 [Rubroshorea leprosula]|uniref:Disease resistance N-terminal domain-containing protein n=1 Tax=Rubroshorea leprosula TaxID=152421 RepID=A0AAV5MLA1_9ROSI|nr:hypothetical protein SLEP1_g57384 [Rubroshorea leprosula]
MADAIVSLILEELKTTIIDRGKEEVKLLVGLEEEMEKLERNLDLIHGVLAHAEEKKRTDDLVKKWVDRLKEAAYDMEDALDEWRTAVDMELPGAENPRKVLLCNFRKDGGLLYLCLSQYVNTARRLFGLTIPISEDTAWVSRNRQALQPKFPLVPVVGVVQLCKPYFYCPPSPPNEPKSKVRKRQDNDVHDTDSTIGEGTST